jgi:hypothetical protein
MKSSLLPWLLIFIVLIVSVYLWNRITILEQKIDELSQPSLYLVMNQMQDQVHKLSYAIEAENAELADFYLHELEEGAEALISANVMYHGEPIGELTKTMLLPYIEYLEEAADEQRWGDARNRFSALVNSCNSCHSATGYPSIVVTERGTVNPYNQDFNRP